MHVREVFPFFRPAMARSTGRSSDVKDVMRTIRSPAFSIFSRSSALASASSVALSTLLRIWGGMLTGAISAV